MPSPDFIEAGFGNGEIPDCGLVPVRFNRNFRLHREAEAQLAIMRSAFAEYARGLSPADRPGGQSTFTLTSAYRNLADQRRVKNQYGDLAADPGTSPHGWGIAIDIKELSTDAVNRATDALIRQSIIVKGNGDPKIHNWIKQHDKLYQWLATNAVKYGWENPTQLHDGNDRDETWHWEYVGFGQNLEFRASDNTTLPAGCADEPPNSGISAGAGSTFSAGTGELPFGAGISPYITSTDSLHPNIQFELTRRRVSSETANAYMPFVRLTALSKVKPENLGDGTGEAYCPTLGVHGEPIVEFDDIYSPQSNNSVVGWATQLVNGTPERVKLVVENGQETDQPNIPIPGITSINLERSTAGPMGVRGGLMKANLKLVAYSVGQLNVLLRYFLRPATRVVLEVGRKSSSPFEQVLELNQQGNPNALKTFDWKRPLNATAPQLGILDELNPLVALQADDTSVSPKDRAQRKFIRKYTYNNFGNYEIFVAYVVTFKLKYTKNNTYEIDLTLHSVQQFEIPVKMTGAKSLCKNGVPNPCDIQDVYEYFSPRSSNKPNSFDGLLTKASDANNEELGKIWSNHVIPLIDRGAENVEEANEGVKSPGYFISWRFFIDVVLRDARYGILSTSTGVSREFISKGLPPQTTETPEESDSYGLYSNEVGWHKNLRSTNPGVLLVINDDAKELNRQKYINDKVLYRRDLLLKQAISGQSPTADNATWGKDQRGINITDDTITDNSIFHAIERAKAVIGTFSQRGVLPVTTLLRGVMINTNAIKQAFTSTDTVANGIASLLTMMNNSVQGFWNLQLLSNDEASPGTHIVDMALSKPVDRELLPASIDTIFDINDVNSIKSKVQDFKLINAPDDDSAKYLYVFNRKLNKGVSNDIGSELLDINLESALPQVVSIQAIAGVGGLASRGVLESIDVPELKRLTLFPDLYATCEQDSDLCGDDGTQPKCKSQFANVITKTLTDDDRRELIDAFNSQNNGSVTSYQELIRLRSTKALQKAPVVSTPAAAGVGSLESESSRTQRDLITNDINKLYRALIEQDEQSNAGLLSLVREYGNSLGRVIEYIEYDVAYMLHQLDRDRESPERNGVHPFNSSNLTKTVVDLTLPGIGGIQLFQAFGVQRVPNILNSGYYVVTKVAHDFSVQNGWTTKIQGRYRHKPRLVTTREPNPCADTPAQ